MINFILMLFSLYSYSKNITITHDQDLNFGVLVQGDSRKTISSNANEINNAQFSVRGDKDTNYTIVLPTESAISLNGSGVSSIKVDSFTSVPAQGANGLLNGQGKQTIYIGATLDEIGVSTSPGSYFGTFTIEVIY